MKNRPHLELYRKYKGSVFQNDIKPKALIREAGGCVLRRPTIPLAWRVKITPHFGLKYFNPNEEEEWVKVCQANPNTEEAIYKKPHVIYHKPTGTIKKPFRNLIPFEVEEQGHILVQLRQSYSDKADRARAAYDALKRYCFKLDDILIVRKQLGFENLPKDILTVLQEKICECHATNLSQSQAGVIFKHQSNPHFAARFAKHIGKKKGFVKLQTGRGYHTASGVQTQKNLPDAHISVEHILDMSIEWYSPPCEKVYSLQSFDYYRDIHDEEDHDDSELQSTDNASELAGAESFVGPPKPYK